MELNYKPDKTIQSILNTIFKHMDEIHESVLLSHMERNQDQEKTDDFIKQQELNNKVIINKLDNILKAIT